METNRPAKNLDEMPLSPEEIRAIGEIELGPAKHEVFLNKHYKKLIYCGIAVMLAASFGVSYYSYKNQQKEEAGALIVQAAGVSATGDIRTADSYETKPLSDVQTNYRDTQSAALAELMEALSQLSDTAHSERGIAALDSLASTSPSELIRSRAAAALASYYMGEKQSDKATEYWQKIISMPINPYTAIAYVSLGDIAKQAGDTEAARDYYQQVTAVCPNSNLSEEGVIGLRLALLKVDAPKPIQPASEPEKKEGVFSTPFESQPAQPTGETGSSSFEGLSTLPGSNQ